MNKRQKLKKKRGIKEAQKNRKRASKGLPPKERHHREHKDKEAEVKQTRAKETVEMRVEAKADLDKGTVQFPPVSEEPQVVLPDQQMPERDDAPEIKQRDDMPKKKVGIFGRIKGLFRK